MDCNCVNVLKRPNQESSLLPIRPLTTWHCPHSHAALLCAVQQSIDISCTPGLQQQTRSSGSAIKVSIGDKFSAAE